jgi:glycosyltransferase involved in cell wall biosynthesis
VTAVRDRLLAGEIPQEYGPLRDTIRTKLQEALQTIDVLIVHNALSLHFNLPLSAALWSLAAGSGPRIISWVHDLSWANPLYRPSMQDREPWDLLRRNNDSITSVFVSRQRCQEWQALTGMATDESQVIPNGIDPFALLRLGSTTRALVQQLDLMSSDVIMLAPVRITRRKNLEWAIQAAAGVRDSGHRVQLLITGPPGPHNPRSMDYVAELKRLIEAQNLQESVRFLFEALASSPAAGSGYRVDAATLSDLYMLSDVVVLPSSSEGFGLPLAEAAIFRVPVVATDLPAFREIAPDGATLVALEAGAGAFRDAVMQALESSPARMRRRVLNTLSWDRLIEQRLEPLLAAK